VIEYNLRYLEAAGVSRVFIVLSDGKEQILRYVKDGRRFGLDVAYVFQDMKRGAGTAKAIEAAKPWLSGEFIVVYGSSRRCCSSISSGAPGLPWASTR